MSIKEPTKPTAQMDLESEIVREIEPGMELPTISEEVRRRAHDAIPLLRAHREEVLASRGGKPIDIVDAVREARAAHARGD